MFMGFVGQGQGKGRAEMVRRGSLGKDPVRRIEATRWLGQESFEDGFTHMSGVGCRGWNTYLWPLLGDWAFSHYGSISLLTRQLRALKADVQREPDRGISLLRQWYHRPFPS